MGEDPSARGRNKSESDLVRLNLPKCREFNIWCFWSDSLTLISLFSLGEAAAPSPSQVYLCPRVTDSPRLVGALRSCTFNTLLSPPPSSLCLTHAFLCLPLAAPSSPVFSLCKPCQTSTRIHFVFTYFTDKSITAEVNGQKIKYGKGLCCWHKSSQ